MNRGLLMCMVGVLSVAAAEAVMAQVEPLPADLAVLAEYLGFERADVDRLLAGETIETELVEGSDKQLAVSIAVLLPATLDEALEAIRSGRTLDIDPEIVRYERLEDGPPSAADFAGVGFTADEIKEVQKLLKVKPGSEFNFSAQEVERLQDLAKRLKGKNLKKDPSVLEAVNAELRAILLERYRAYRERGLDGIAPYARGGRKTADPADELELALKQEIEADAALASTMRRAKQALRDYPHGGSEDLEHHYYWIKQTVQKRPTFILAHRMVNRRPDALLIAERQYYVGHDYNSLSIFMGAVPVEGGVVVFYRNSTFTDQVAGFGSGMKHDIGRKQMKSSIVERFTAARETIESER